MISYNGIDLKIARAREHFANLDKQIRDFIKANPYPVQREYDSVSKENIFRVTEDPKELPAELGIVVGEMAYNFRSALDILVNHLIEVNGKPITKTTAFPIFDQTSKWDSNYASKLSGLNSVQIDIIKREQPCFAKNYDGRGRFLGYLEDICNGDKHRKVTLVSAGMDGYGITYTPIKISHDQVTSHLGSVKKGTILLRVKGPDADIGFGIFPGVAFGNEGPAAGILFSEFYHTINYVVPEIIVKLGGKIDSPPSTATKSS